MREDGDCATVAQVGERALLRRILDRLSPPPPPLGPGDDAALLTEAGVLVATVDALVEGPDFRRPWSSGADLGWKAVAVNLADVAAMGASPQALLLALALPPATPVGFVDDLATGIRMALDDLAPRCIVAGGDLSATDTLTVTVTALGRLPGPPVLRSGARPGDIVAVAGEMGTAARGLSILRERFRTASGEPAAVDTAVLDGEERRAVAAQLRPRPPLAAGPAAASGGATAMIDVSDGLAGDATRIAEASGVTIDLDAAALGPDPALALAGGEDHALLATFPAGSLPGGFRLVGTVRARGASPLTVDGSPHAGTAWDPYRSEDGAAHHTAVSP